MLKEDDMDGTRLYVFVPPPYSLLPFPSALLDTREKQGKG